MAVARQPPKASGPLANAQAPGRYPGDGPQPGGFCHVTAVLHPANSALEELLPDAAIPASIALQLRAKPQGQAAVQATEQTIGPPQGYLADLQGIAQSGLSVGDKLHMAWDSTKYHWRNSGTAQGAAQITGGALEVASGLALTAGSDGLAAAIGMPLAVHGGDEIGAGVDRIWSGGDSQTITFKAVEALSGSPNIANAVDKGIPFLGLAAGAGAAVTALTDARAVTTGLSETARATGETLISDVRAVSAADANAPFLAKGWDAPYSYGSQARTFTTASDLDFVRVTTTNPQGAFLVRPGEIAGISAEQIQVHLALPKVPTSILDVRVPAGTRMQTGFVGPQPSFGVNARSGIQYQILDQIPSSSFGPMRPLP